MALAHHCNELASVILQMSFMYMVVARVCHMPTQLARYSYFHGFKLGWCMGVSNKDMNVNKSTDYTPFVSLIATPPPPYSLQ